MSVRTAVLLGTALVCAPLVARSEKLTLQCRFEIGSEGRERDVNQVLIDTEAPQIDFRVAQTIGTSNQIDFTFKNDKALKDTLQLVVDGPKIDAAAIRFGSAVGISFNKRTGSLNWVWADGSRSFQYGCRQ